MLIYSQNRRGNKVQTTSQLLAMSKKPETQNVEENETFDNTWVYFYKTENKENNKLFGEND